MPTRVSRCEQKGKHGARAGRSVCLLLRTVPSTISRTRTGRLCPAAGGVADMGWWSREVGKPWNWVGMST